MICSVPNYRKITRDYDNTDVDILDALTKAQHLMEQRTDRYFERRDAAGALILRTETAKLHRNGLIYPRATPLHSVTAPSGAAISGNGISNATRSTETPFGHWSFPWQYLAGTATYAGGYEPGTIPEEIIQAIAELANLALPTSPITSQIPVGATTVHVGDVSFSGSNISSRVASVPSHIFNVILLWKRREA